MYGAISKKAHAVCFEHMRYVSKVCYKYAVFRTYALRSFTRVGRITRKNVI